MRPAEIEVKINLARREMEFWQGVLADKRCGNCIQLVDGMCSKYQAIPPAGLKEPACEDWSWDSIPF